MTASGDQSNTPRCPYCGNLIGSEDNSVDDTFIEALGGQATVPACVHCNSRIGSDIEGRMQRPDPILSLVKARDGRGQLIRGTVVATGDEVSYDFAQGSCVPAGPCRNRSMAIG